MTNAMYAEISVTGPQDAHKEMETVLQMENASNAEAEVISQGNAISKNHIEVADHTQDQDPVPDQDQAQEENQGICIKSSIKDIIIIRARKETDIIEEGIHPQIHILDLVQGKLNKK